MNARRRRERRERTGMRVKMLPGRCPVHPAHCASASARGCRQRQDAVRQPVQNSEDDRARALRTPCKRYYVVPECLRASLWVGSEIDAMDGKFLPAGMKLPAHV